MQSCSTEYQGENGHNITFSAVFGTFTVLSFQTVLSDVVAEHISFHSHSHPALLRESGDVQSSLDKRSLLQITPLFLPLCLPSSLSPSLFCACICLLSTTALQGSSGGSCDAARSLFSDSHMHISLNPRQCHIR